MFSTRISVITGVCTVALFGLVVASSSCKKNNDEPTIPVEETKYADEQIIIEQIYSSADRIVERAFASGANALKGGEDPLAACASVKVDTTDNPDISRMTITFAGNCLGYDGRYRKGSMIVDYTNKIKITDQGYYHKITFYEYEVEGYRVGGYKEVANKGLNNGGNVYYNIYSKDTVYLPKNSGKITSYGERTREWFSGINTPERIDDVYRLTGYGYFTSLDKEEYYLEIAEPLIDALDCNWLKQGVINIFPGTSTQRVLNFGDGSCDDVATISVNGVKREVKIP